jgi:hypothetical protein
MAVDWLDLARFADSHGYTVDRLRDMSPWRDWVIKAFNKNLPYDRFVTWQLAGDLLPNPAKEQLIATAFNRNHQQNMEGGIIEEEFRVEYVSDRVNTTSEAIMGLTAGCARCHDHKFDPISQKEYYQMFSFFNNVKEAGQISWDNAMPVPTMLITTPEKERILNYLKNAEHQKYTALNIIKEGEDQVVEQWINSGAYKKLAQTKFPNNIVAHFPLNNATLKNSLKNSEQGVMKRTGSTNETPVIVPSAGGNALQFNGDAWLDLNGIGKYKSSEPFSVALWVHIPKELKSGVIFHRGTSGLLYNFRGFHVALEDNKLQLVMAHTAPYNAIIEYSKIDVPKEEWVHLGLTYDGLGKANGFKIYLNGAELETVVDQDNLYKDIMLGDFKNQPGLQFGGWDRGKGFAGGLQKDVTVFSRDLTPIEIMQLSNRNKFESIVNKAPSTLSAIEKNILKDYFLSVVSEKQKTAKTELLKLRAAYIDSVQNVPELMIMQEMPVPRKAYVLDRGQYDTYKEEVSQMYQSLFSLCPKIFHVTG